VKTERYERKRFFVDVVKVTEENFLEVADWVKGVTNVSSAGKFIKVAVNKPQNERQTQAFVGDYILKSSTGFKVFTKGAFEVSFMPAPPIPEKVGSKKNPRSPRGTKKGTPDTGLAARDRVIEKQRLVNEALEMPRELVRETWVDSA
jgi:hypothetical protein